METAPRRGPRACLLQIPGAAACPGGGAPSQSTGTLADPGAARALAATARARATVCGSADPPVRVVERVELERRLREVGLQAVAPV
jgi:hypothetical protein